MEWESVGVGGADMGAYFSRQCIVVQQPLLGEECVHGPTARTTKELAITIFKGSFVRI